MAPMFWNGRRDCTSPAAGAGVYGHDGGARVVLAGEQHGSLQALQVFGVGLEVAFDIARH